MTTAIAKLESTCYRSHMDLATYLQEPGAASRLAREIGKPAAMVSQFKAGTRTIPVQVCIAIERATKGSVRCEELRPEIDWAYLSQRDQIAA